MEEKGDGLAIVCSANRLGEKRSQIYGGDFRTKFLLVLMGARIGHLQCPPWQ